MSSTCPDCEGALRPFKLIDATEIQLGGKGTRHVGLAYASARAKSSLLGSHIKAEGLVTGVLCSSCGRIFIYGETR
jgi:hypothetical protein